MSSPANICGDPARLAEFDQLLTAAGIRLDVLLETLQALTRRRHGDRAQALAEISAMLQLPDCPVEPVELLLAALWRLDAQARERQP